MEEKSRYPSNSADHGVESVQFSRILHPNAEEQAFHHHLTLGIEDTLQAHPLIRDIKMIIRHPVIPATLLAWERKFRRKLPIDLKSYYYSTNGFRLTWSLEYGNELLRVGEMNINSLNHLTPLSHDGSNDSKGSSHSRMLSMYSTESSSGNGKRHGQKHADSEHGHHHSAEISFAEFQKMKNESKRSAEASSSSKSSGISSSLLLPPEGQAFQLDSSKSEKGMVCLVYLTSASKIRLRRHQQTTSTSSRKVADNVLDFSHEKQHNTSSRREDNTIERRKSFQNSHVFSTENLNKSLEEFQAEQEVATSQTNFLAEDDSNFIQIWFLDSSFQWHFLAPSFSHYYRMMLYHFGLPEWEYRFTPFGVSSWAEQMYWIVAPHLLQPVKNHQNSTATANQKNKNASDNSNIWSTDYPTEAGKPNPINNVINMNLFRKKKKDKND